MSVDQSIDMQPIDITLDLPDTTADECAITQWFAPEARTCNSCPAPAITCEDINVGGAMINAEARTLLFNMNSDVHAFLRVNVTWEETYQLCNMDEGGECFPYTTTDVRSFLPQDNVVLVMIPKSNEEHVVRIQTMEFEDKCGTKTTVAIEAEWDVDNNRVIKTLQCP